MRTTKARWLAVFAALIAFSALGLGVAALLGDGDLAGANPASLANEDELAQGSDWLSGQGRGRAGAPAASGAHGEERTLRSADLGAGVVVGVDGLPVPGATLVLFSRRTSTTVNEVASSEAVSGEVWSGEIAEPSATRVERAFVTFSLALQAVENAQGSPGLVFTDVSPTVNPEVTGPTTLTTPWEVVRTWRADGEGRFALEDLPEGEILLDAHDGLRALAVPLERAEIEAAGNGLRLALAAGQTISGFVRDGAGAALAGVETSCGAVAWDDGRIDPVAERKATTDATGAYRIEGVRAGARYQMRFSLENYFSHPEPEVLEVRRDEPLDHTMLAHATLAGTVREGGAPREAVELELRGFGMEKSDAEGRFRFRPRLDEPRDVEIFARTADQQLLGYLKVRLAPAERREDLVLALERACIVRGRVVDETGRPIAGAGVTLSWAPEPERNAEDASVQELALGSYLSRVQGRALANVFSYRLRTAQLAFDNVRLSRPAIRRPGGWIVSGQEPQALELAFGPDGKFLSAWNGIQLDSNGPAPHAAIFEEQRSAQTDEQGRFEFLGVWAGSYRLSASHAEHLAGEDREFTVAPGEEHQAELVLPRGAKVGGVVLGADGSPSAQATVIAVRDANEIQRVQADAEGRFSLVGMSPGDLDLVGNDEAGSAVTALRGLSLLNGTEIGDLVLRLGAGAALFGRIVDGMGAPIANAQVEVRSLLSSSSQFQVSTEADGNFRIDRMLHGDHAVSISAEGYLPLSIERISIDGALRRDFALERGATLSGTIYAPDGSPMAGAQVFLFHGENEGHVESDAQGRYAFSGLHPGPCQLYVRAEDYSSSVRASRELSLGQDVERFDLKLRPSGRVSGRVLDLSGRPLAGVSITGFTEPAGKGRRDTTSGPDGRFELGRLYPDRYRIFAGDDPAKGIVIDASSGGELAPIELRLTP